MRRFRGIANSARAGALSAILAAVAPVTVADQAPQRFLALGDSYTIGEGVADGDRWPVQLARALRAERVGIADPEIIARTGWTTDELDQAINERAPRGPYALVTLLIGVNNQYRGRSVPEFARELSALVDRARGFAGGDVTRVILVSIPDWGVTRFNRERDREQVARDINAYNVAVRDAASKAGAHWVDITDLTRAEPAAVVDDGLHPNASMYARWVTRVLPVARAILRAHQP